MPIHYEQDDEHIVLHHDRPARGPELGRHGALQAAPRGVGALRRRRRRVGRDHHRRRRRVLHRRRPQDATSREITKLQQQHRRRTGSARSTATASTTARRRCCATSKLWKPIIAAVNGFCTAGGMEMLGGVDIRVALPRGQVRGDGAQARAVRGRRHHRAPARARSRGRRRWSSCSAPTSSPPQRALRDGAPERGRPARAAARHGVRVRRDHRERAARVQATKQSVSRALPDELQITRSQAASAARRHRDRRPTIRPRLARVAADVLDGLARTAHRVRARSRISTDLPDRGRQGGPARRSRRSARRTGRRDVARDGGRPPRRRASSASGQQTWHPTRSATTARPSRCVMWEEVARVAADDSGVGARSLEELDALEIVYCQTWQYDDPPARLADAPRRRRPSAATTRASAARRRRCSCRTPRTRILAGEVDVVLHRRRRGARHAAPRYKQAGERYPYSFKPDREAPVPVGGAVPSGRGRARGVPGVADVRDVRQRAAARTSASGSTSTGAQLGEMMAPMTDDRGREPERVVPGRPRRSTRSSRRGPRTAWSATRTRSTWSSMMDVDMAAARAASTSHEAADALGVPPEQRVYLRGLVLRDRSRLRRRAPRDVALAGDGGGERRGVPRRRASASTTSPTSTCTAASAAR